jgi:PAS domain S-box-containing protein
MTDVERCPITGLPVLSEPEWTRVAFGDDYAVTVRIIGPAIVHVQHAGSASFEPLREAMNLIQAVIEIAMAPGQPYVQIDDCSDLRSASTAARRHFVEVMRRREGLVGLVFCRTPFLIKIAFQLGIRLIRARIEAVLVDDLGSGIRVAGSMLEEHGVSLVEPTPSRREPASPILSLKREGFTLTYSTPEPGLLHVVATGTLTAEHLDAIFAADDEVVQSVEPADGSRVVVVDATGLVRVTFGARQRYLRHARRWYPKHGVSTMVAYGTRPLVRAAANLARPVAPFRIRVVRSREAAMAVARQLTASSLPPIHRRTHPDDAVEDLLRYLGSIDWEAEGVPERDPDLGSDHAFATILDAIELVKIDVDQIFSQRHLTEEALRASEARYRGILQSIVDGYYEVDLEGNMVFFNDPVPSLIGLKPGEMRGLNFRDYMDEDTACRAHETFKQVFDSGLPARARDWELIHRNGSRVVVETSISLRLDPAGTPLGFRGIVRDITERVRAEDERRRLREQLLHAQRMEALGTLAGGIAHNFNNLLMGIQGHVSFLAMESDSDQPQARRLRIIEGLVQSGARLTSQLLGYARAEQAEMQAVDVNELARRIADTYALTHRDHHVDLDLDSDLPPVLADQGQIEQVLLNLMINAGDAMTGPGTITLRSCREERTPTDGEGEEVESTPYACLSVADTGIGMSPETIDRVFEPFFTTKASHGGTGLGLSTAYGIVTAHNGLIEVRSTPGRGSVFDVLLPIPVSTNAFAATAQFMPEPVTGRNMILIVEDDEPVLEAISGMVSTLQSIPVWATSGREAINIVAERGATIDLVILDVNLPDLRGGEVFDAMRRSHPGIKVLLASGYGLEGEPESILKRGCNGYIQKPFNLDQLAAKLGEILG